MKKILTLILCLCLVLCLVACDNNDSAKDTDINKVQEELKDTNGNDSVGIKDDNNEEVSKEELEQNDDAAMAEITDIVLKSFSTQMVYDEWIMIFTKDNVIAYGPSEDGVAADFANESAKGFTLTFQSENGLIKIGDAVVNIALDGSKTFKDISMRYTIDGENYEENQVLCTNITKQVGNEIMLKSEKYKNSDYTIFVYMQGRNINVSGQWNGTNLPD